MKTVFLFAAALFINLFGNTATAAEPRSVPKIGTACSFKGVIGTGESHNMACLSGVVVKVSSNMSSDLTSMPEIGSKCAFDGTITTEKHAFYCDRGTTKKSVWIEVDKVASLPHVLTMVIRSGNNGTSPMLSLPSITSLAHDYSTFYTCERARARMEFQLKKDSYMNIVSSGCSEK